MTDIEAKRRQVAAQSEAVAYMCDALSQLCRQRAQVCAAGRSAHDETLDVLGERTAIQMAWLGAQLNSIGADAAPAWMDQILEKAHQMYPLAQLEVLEVAEAPDIDPVCSALQPPGIDVHEECADCGWEWKAHLPSPLVVMEGFAARHVAAQADARNGNTQPLRQLLKEYSARLDVRLPTGRDGNG